MNRSALVSPSAASGRHGKGEHPEIVEYIRRAAQARGIDPDIALGVARSEGLRGSTPKHMVAGDQRTSFGPYQLHYRSNIPGLSNPGLGDAFTRQTGKHASDPTTWREQIDFAHDEAAKGGWGPWHGWRGPRRAGLSGARPIGRTPDAAGSGAAPAGGPSPFGDTMRGMWPRHWADRIFGQAPAVPQVNASGSVKIELFGMPRHSARIKSDGMFTDVDLKHARPVHGRHAGGVRAGPLF